MTATTDPGVALLRGARKARTLGVLLMTVALALACAASIAIGSREVGLSEVWVALTGSAEGFEGAAVLKRVPRTALAALAGAALAVSGLALQGVTRNPLAEPGILGINTGASLAVVCGIAWFGLTSPVSYIWTAIAGAASAAAFVWMVGSLGRDGATPLKLTLAGAATAAALTSFVTGVVLPRPDISESVVSWQIGGVGGATDAALQRMLPFIAAGFLICLWQARGLNLLGMGDDLAASLGQHVTRTRLVAAFGGVILCGATTAVCGPIAFVGLVVPHFCRLFVGHDHRWLIPICALGGACLLLVTDTIGRVIAPPSEVDVGILTALIGAPIFILAVRQRRVREL